MKQLWISLVDKYGTTKLAIAGGALAVGLGVLTWSMFLRGGEPIPTEAEKRAQQLKSEYDKIGSAAPKEEIRPEELDPNRPPPRMPREVGPTAP